MSSKCASRINDVHFFDIWTSKSGPSMVCFVHFDKFGLRNVLRATTACTFSSLIWPDGSAPAALASLLFAPPEPQIIGKNTVFRDFPTFSRIWASLFWLFLTLLWSSLFYSDSFRLFFSSVHIVGSLTSKLPSIIFDQYIPVISHDLPRATRDLLWDIMGSNPLEGKRMKHVMGKQRWNHEILGEPACTQTYENAWTWELAKPWHYTDLWILDDSNIF